MNTSTETIYQPETYYKFNPFARNWIATYGVMTTCEHLQCHWVLDVIASYVSKLSGIKDIDYFLIITVKVNDDQSAVFTLKQEDQLDSDEVYRTLITQELDYTDLKEDITFWAINESPGNYDPQNRTVVLLPDEY